LREKPKELFIIDAHVHLGYCANFYMPDISLEKMIAVMDRFGIEKVCCSHLAGLLAHHFEYAHEQTLDAIQNYPGRIFGYAIYDPIFPEDSLRIVEKYMKSGGFVGVKIHPAMHAYPLDGENYDPLWEYAAANDIPVLTHTWDATPQTTYPYELVASQVNAQPKLIHKIAKKYPDLKIILAHAGGHYRGHLQAIEMVKKFENVYVDICGATFSFGLIEWFVKEIGAHKILYGSDMTWIEPRVHLGRVLGAKISLTEKEQILSLNAKKIFKFS